jgi:exosortase F-associated protein
MYASNHDRLAIVGPWRVVLIAISLVGLAGVFLFQHASWLNNYISQQQNPNLFFSVQRILRVLLNDGFMTLLLVGWFASRDVFKMALILQAIDLFILLPIYLVIKLSFEGNTEISSPLLSQFHRLIVNPTLLILLIPAVYFQRFSNKE